MAKTDDQQDERQFVWVFQGNEGRFVSGVFSTRAKAEVWILPNRHEGILTKTPVDICTYEWAVEEGHFTPKKPRHFEPGFIASFSSASQEHYHYWIDESGGYNTPDI